MIVCGKGRRVREGCKAPGLNSILNHVAAERGPLGVDAIARASATASGRQDARRMVPAVQGPETLHPST